MQSLKYFEASNNALGGSIPEELYDLVNLEAVYLYHNQLSGTISTKIGNLDNILHLQLSHNQLTGTIPTGIESEGDIIRPIRKLQPIMLCFR